MEWIHDHLKQAPEIALFLSLAFGYWIGQIQFGKFQLGGVAGSLLVAVIVSQLGVSVDAGVKSILFALFIYAVGFESGPGFFRSLGRQSVKEIILAVVLAVSGLATVVILARLFDLDKGLAAGVAAGGLTQSAIIGTAGDALTKMGLSPDEVHRLQANVAIGYAVTYVFGSFGAIIVCVNILPWFMGRGIRDDAVAAEAAMNKGQTVLGVGQTLALPGLVGRLFRVDQGAGKTVAQIEDANREDPVTVERVKRKGRIIDISADLALEHDDTALVVGRRAGMVAAAAQLGPEVQSATGMDLIMQTRDVALTNPAYAGRTIADIREATAQNIRHGIYVPQIHRAGTPVAMTPDAIVERGDVVTLYGSEQDIKRVSKVIGDVILPSDKTDFVFHGLGLVVGLLIGLVVVRISGIPLTLGAGGGALLSGLIFGWIRSGHQTMGNMPTGAVQLLKDIGLAGFVAAVGLSSGLQAVQTIRESGLTIFLVGVIVTIVPLLITMVFGRYVLRYDNVAVFAGALSGSRSANPAFGEVLNKAENAVPTVPFAITYALANVFLTLLGPLIVAFA
ncbi:aspartate-alanine antiporter [Vineibacter terrae]|uniref:aspartate-alanine antiporter n=1 Tax=Vineibacter terrae TaxID=2586908 RepID=UPI002E36E42F|nr:aspartate-alanine antiporter [Vineibacter terrae]HEX2891017.1 aspartate-alanine antiporter [Vineibacter terrae]